MAVIDERPYEVFGRSRQDSTAWHLGMVRATSLEDAEVFAFMTFDEQKWVEMFVYPRSSATQLVAPE